MTFINAVTVFLILAVAFAFFGLAVKRLVRLSKSLREVRELVLSQRHWRLVPGRVIRLGYGLDYGYPYRAPNVEGIEDIGELEQLLARLQIEERRAIEALQYKDVLMLYSFAFEGKHYQSRRISSLPSREDVELIYKSKPGGSISVFVNPDNPNESVLEPSSERRFSRYCIEQLWRARVDFAIALLTPILLLVGMAL